MPLDGVVPFPPELAARYRRLGYWRDETLDQVFSELFDRHRDRVALLASDHSITYGELGQRSASMAGALYERGLRPLDRVVLHLPNGPEFVQL
ncbi:MAG TPA: AMP-binding protein, partial [Myxococcaceae bacterium]